MRPKCNKKTKRTCPIITILIKIIQWDRKRVNSENQNFQSIPKELLIVWILVHSSQMRMDDIKTNGFVNRKVSDSSRVDMRMRVKYVQSGCRNGNVFFIKTTKKPEAN